MLLSALQKEYIVYRAKCCKCIDLKTTGGEIIPIYIGETSRPVRMRVAEHWKNLDNRKEDSFMLQHWVEAHGTEMIPPDFTFEVIKQYRDAYSRQIAEALYIMNEGSLNNKTEFGINYVCRLETGLPEWRGEALYKDEQKRKIDSMEKIKSFCSVLKSVESLSKANETSISRLIKTTNKRMADTGMSGKKEKRSKGEERPQTSTPITWCEGTRKSLSPTRMDSSMSPIKIFNVSRDEVDPEIYNKSSGMDSLMDLSRGSKTNLSNEVVKLLRSPRTERESEELLAVLRQTIDWTRAAMETGVVRKCLSDPDLVIDLQTNSMFRPIRRAKSVSFCKLFETLNIKNWTADDLLCPESGENQLR